LFEVHLRYDGGFMNRSNLLISFALFTFTIIFVMSASAGTEKVLARIGEKIITRADLERILDYNSGDRRKALDMPENRIAFLTRIVQSEAVAEIARKSGFDRKEEVSEQVRMLVNDFLASEYLRQEILAKTEVTEENLKLYYKARPYEFISPDTIRARHILVKVSPNASEEEKEGARLKAAEILQRLKGGEDFAELAASDSEDAGTKNRGGDLGSLPKTRLDPEFAKAAFALNPGELSDPVLTRFGYHIILLEEKKAGVMELFEAVRERVEKKVRDDMSKARVREFMDEAMKNAGAEIYPEHLFGE
jgi:parvulin-like peptidyl-prolyl isomerase